MLSSMFVAATRALPEGGASTPLQQVVEKALHLWCRHDGEIHRLVVVWSSGGTHWQQKRKNEEKLRNRGSEFDLNV